MDEGETGDKKEEFGGRKEGTAEAYRDIVNNADERFEVAKIDADLLAFFASIEVVWRG